jgi:outer membrane lipoprotein-sorting protein
MAIYVMVLTLVHFQISVQAFTIPVKLLMSVNKVILATTITIATLAIFAILILAHTITFAIAKINAGKIHVIMQIALSGVTLLINKQLIFVSKIILKQRMIIALITMLIAVSGMSVNGQNTPQNAVAQFQKAINGLKSFDASISVIMLDYSQNQSNPKIVEVETNRDVFAVGLGRRFERNVSGEKYGIGVIDWKTATSLNSRLANVLNVVSPGLSYLDFVNPSPGDGFFLTDVLNDKRVTIQAIYNTNTPTLFAFQLGSSQLNGNPHTIVRIWLDPEHGYMLNKMEWWNQSPSGLLTLSDRMQVEKSLKVAEGLWVPVKARMIYFSDDERELIEYAYFMTLEEKHSSFNTITSDTLFLAASLNKLNYEKNGWKWDYPSTQLAASKDFDFAIKAALTGNPRGFWLVVILFAINIFLFAFMLRKMRKAKAK